LRAAASVRIDDDTEQAVLWRAFSVSRSCVRLKVPGVSDIGPALLKEHAEAANDSFLPDRRERRCDPRRTPPAPDVPAALAGLGADPAAAQPAYRRFVLEAIDCEDRLWDKVTRAIYLGSEPWANEMRKLVGEQRARRITRRRSTRSAGPECTPSPRQWRMCESGYKR
jgi:hypothetical protein